MLLLILFAAILLPGGWIFFALLKVFLLFWLVVALIGLVGGWCSGTGSAGSSATGPEGQWQGQSWGGPGWRGSQWRGPRDGW